MQPAATRAQATSRDTITDVTSVRASATLPESAVPRPRTWPLAAVLLPPATAIVIGAVALLILLTPPWMHLALDLSGGSSGLATLQQAHELSDQTVVELFAGPGTFAAFAADEAGHMRDVRLVLWGFLGLALASFAIVAWRLSRHGRSPQTWQAVARGGLLLVGVTVVVGLFATLAFGVAFELFHRVFFPGGNWAFAQDSLLIRLYPYEFWQLTAGALGVLLIVGGVVVWWFARRRARE